MSKTITSITIGIFGSRGAQASERHGCGLWDAGHGPCVAAEGAEPVFLGESLNGRSWERRERALPAAGHRGVQSTDTAVARLLRVQRQASDL